MNHFFRADLPQPRPLRQPTAAERNKLFADVCDLAEWLGRQLTEGRSGGAQENLPYRSNPMACLEALSELAAAVECAADNTASDARREGASDGELGRAWGISDVEASRKWGPPAASPFPTDPDLLGRQALADGAAIASLQRALEHGRAERDQLRNELDNRIVMEQATGILAERWHVAVGEAFAAFGGYARADRRRLASEIVDSTAHEGSTAQQLTDERARDVETSQRVSGPPGSIAG